MHERRPRRPAAPRSPRDGGRGARRPGARARTSSRSRRWSARSATLTYEGTDHAVSQFVGTYPSYFAASNSPVGTGAAFTDDDVAQGRRVVVIGQTVAEELFPGVDPVGKQVTVSGALFTVVGVLAEKSSPPASRTPTTSRSRR